MIYSKEGLLDAHFAPLDPEVENQILELEEQKSTQAEFYKPNDNIWLKMIPDKKYKALRKMGESNLDITSWMQKNVQYMAFAGVIGLLLGMFFNKLFFLFALFVPAYMYYNKLKFIDLSYNQWQFSRRVQFNKFVRLIIPYLKQTEHHISMNTILGKVAPRLDEEEDRNLVQQLRRDIMDHPHDVVPFQEYAERASGTNQAALFMSTLYDIQQGATDMQVVDELGRNSSEELLHSIDQIIDYKDHKFTFYPTKLTMYLMILIMGFTVSYLIYSISQLHLGSLGL